MKLPRDLDGAQVVRALGRLGFETVRQVGNHIQLRKASLRVTVPAHRPIRAGTL